MAEGTPRPAPIDVVASRVLERYAGLITQGSENPLIQQSFENFVEASSVPEPMSQERMDKINRIKADKILSAKAVILVKNVSKTIEGEIPDEAARSFNENILDSMKEAEAKGGDPESVENFLIAGFELIAEGEEKKFGISSSDDAVKHQTASIHEFSSDEEAIEGRSADKSSHDKKFNQRDRQSPTQMFEYFREFARNLPEDEWKEGEEDFETWTNRWVIKRMKAVQTISPQNMIVGARMVDAQLQVGYQQMGISIGQFFDYVPLKYTNYASDMMSQLKVMSTIHNDERLYSSVKTMGPDKIDETMTGLSERGMGQSETMAIEGVDLQKLFSYGEVLKGKETFGETFRKGLALYCAMDVSKFNGDLTAERLMELGFKIPTLEKLVELGFKIPPQEESTVPGPKKPGFMDEIVKKDEFGVEYSCLIENFFPIQSMESSFVDKQRNTMKAILCMDAGCPEAAELAEMLAFKASQAWLMGASLDSLAQGKEQAYKLVRTYEWRKKYIKDPKPAGLPISLPDFIALTPTFVDAVNFPLEKNGDLIPGKSYSLREWILGEKMGRVPANEIPVDKAMSGLYYQYFDQGVHWGAWMFKVITQGSQVPWAGLVGRSEKGKPIDPKFATSIADMYKNVSYWTSSLTINQLGCFFDTFEPNDGKMNEWCARTRLNKEEHPDAYLSPGKFRKLVTKKVTRRLLLREVQAFNSKYNPAAKVGDRLLGKAFGEIIEKEDLENIVQLLVNEVGKNLQAEAVLGDERDEFLPLFTGEKDVMNFLAAAGLFDFDQTILRLGKIAGDVSEKMWNVKRFH